MNFFATCIQKSILAGMPDVPLVTLELTYPRFIHAEFMTHRVFSRNAQSSRAVPVRRMLERIETVPVYPSEWGVNQGGMQSAGPMEPARASLVQAEWNRARYAALEAARNMMKLGAHKQVVNRVLEPYATITTIVSSTEWENFFHLRLSELADPTMRELAEDMQEVIDGATAQILEPGEWHLPYITKADRDWVEEAVRSGWIHYTRVEALAKISSARCARVSYLNHDGSMPDQLKDLELANRLAKDQHMSPFEHVAAADEDRAGAPYWSGNFRSPWLQYRQMLD